MENQIKQNEEKKPFVLPTNLPTIQITFKSSGEKTTRLISENTKIPTKIDEEEINYKTKIKVELKRKSWFRKNNNEIFGIPRITSRNEIFSNAVLGPKTPDLVDLLPLFQINKLSRSLENLFDNHPSTSKMSLSEESQSNVSTTSSKISITPPQISPTPTKNFITPIQISMTPTKNSTTSTKISITPPQISPTPTQISVTPIKKCTTPTKIPPLKITIPIEKPPILKSPSKNVSLNKPPPTNLNLTPPALNLNVPTVSTSPSNPTSLASTLLSPTQIQSTSTCQLVDKSDEESVSNLSNKDAVFLQPEIIPLSSAKNVLISKGNCGFKIPISPKRPPSRLKYIDDLRGVLQHTKLDQLPPSNNSFNNDDIDGISLYAESIASTFDVNPTKNSPPAGEDFTKDVDIDIDFCKNTIDFSKSFPAQNTSKDTVNIETNAPLTKSNVENIQKDEKINEPEIVVNPKISDWISTTTTVNKNQSTDYGNFPKRWCYQFLETGSCIKHKCHFKHMMIEVDFNTVSEKNFEIVFNACVGFAYLFKTFFDSLLLYMIENERKDLILSLVLTVMKRVKDEKMPYIKKIIDTLKNIGFTFVEAINEILLTCGRNNESLLDILLAFAVEDEDCIKTSWSVIANLINFRRTSLDFGVTQDIFTKCVNDYDKTLAENIYKDVVVKNNFDLNRIDRSILIKYISLLQEHHHEGADYIITNYHINSYELQKSNNQQNQLQNEEIIEKIDDNRDMEEPLPLSDFDIEDLNDLQGNNLNLSQCDDSGNCSQKGKQPILIQQNQYLKDSPSKSNQSSTQTRSNPNYNCDTDQYQPYIPRKRSKTEYSPSSSTHTVQTAIIPNVFVDADDLTDQDIKDLVISVRSHNLGSMFSVMSRYSDNEIKIKNVVLNFLAVAKELELDTLCSLLSQMFNVFGNHCKTDYKTMNVLKTLGFNLIPRLDKGKKYETVNDILNFFAIDYNSFVKYNYLGNDRKYNTNEMKYIILFKLLCRCKKYNDAYELLKNHESQLLHIYLPNQPDVINEYKVNTINKCLKSTLLEDPVEAKDMIVYLMLNASVEAWPDLKIFLNILLIQFLNNYRILKDEAISMFDVILNGWYQHLKPSVLRSLLISTRQDVPTKTVLKLFNICIEMEVYPDHKGRDNSISIPTNLLKEEIGLLVHHQLLQICSSLFPISNVVINVTVPLDMDEYSRLHTTLKDNALTTSDMICRVLMVLKNITNFPTIESLDVQNQYIVLPYSSAFLQPYKDAMKTGIFPKIP